VVGGTVLAPVGPVRADVATSGGRVTAVGAARPGGDVLDAAGLVVAPG